MLESEQVGQCVRKGGFELELRMMEKREGIEGVPANQRAPQHPGTG